MPEARVFLTLRYINPASLTRQYLRGQSITLCLGATKNTVDLVAQHTNGCCRAQEIANLNEQSKNYAFVVLAAL